MDAGCQGRAAHHYYVQPCLGGEPDGGFVANQEQAKTVKLIYKLFLDGLTCHAIAKELTERKLPTPGGKAVWSQSTVCSILTNEKCKGDALLQKEFTVDFLQKETETERG